MAALPPIDTERLIADRRDFHMHPELGYQEVRTAERVAQRLRELGYEVRTGVGKTGVIGVRRKDGTVERRKEQARRTRSDLPPFPRSVLLRADMDALAVTEANDLSFRSTTDGVMHACGHDGHIAVGLSVAQRLATADPPGAIKLVFQPAEEGGKGAVAVIDDGALEQPSPDAAFGMHLWSDLPTGVIAIAPGAVFASVDLLEITVTGRGGHAAMPHLAIDPVVVAAHLVTALQTVISRRRDPTHSAVLSVTAIHGGTTHNVIPDRATLLGTVRTYGGEFFDNAPTLIEEVARGVARTFGASAKVKYERLCPPTVNDGSMAALMASVAEGIVGAGNVVPDYRTMAGEDMAFFLERVPGCYAFVGCRNPAKGADHPHHSPHFNIDEDALTIAVELLSQTALRFLTSGM
ncbi:MAG: amidohydrolase [Gemmatimonadales bacterium]|nr:amidohydrolase [Gemmatimonadales bacterium]NIN10636.1 amidohydrolase [Gemmatimonadales bacterium]NIN49398.1 amidohydrolase [Gemmatimonadales bacterium]NIP06862.1 amidohydrolase [Gemmatimonadales bacterium]NIR01536.1 amidohydrolase [Gemmatimonadales bacterium]